ncbi:recombinase RecT [Bacillus sp. FDAARGOS_1420]|uniref:recombinase RecT n=1 Tax=unclassified Bacillus (in: firmicutes) TaxID=185979 RepID=UPI001C5ADD97|nr:recombinase RecT [Bacillus sp. FDAARGOS_1420]MBW3493229.1 recombinase RecT [Bacillus sp. FDAARGOS_1420]
MATNETLKNQMAAQKNEVSTETNFNTGLKQMFKKQFKAIESIVPKGMTPERLIRVGLNATTRNPKLLECSPDTIVGAVVNCGSLGLEPNLLGHAYIVPFYNSKTGRYEAQFQLGYKGIMELVRRSGEVKAIYAHEVYEGDTFEFEYGLEKNIVHKPCGEEDQSKITHFYAVYKLKDGGYDFIVMSRKQLESHRDKFTKSQKNGVVFGPWKDHFVEMAKKTVIIKLLKTAPLSIEREESRQVIEAINQDNGIMKVKENNTGVEADAGFIDVEYAEVTEE